ncbi:uncharacterized protein LOC123897350 [Trifolium pratense]|uniref:uncharacterized protein LOC123897350 n=1 Tax=Trifolium pratense TaxID=57577 RepID=UPI001E691A58|nr:uncharacterized protein LOC123897350 [Trifolium pratense]
MKNPRYRHSQPPQQPPQGSDVLAASPPPSLLLKGIKSLKETVMGVALSLWCILDGWANLILLYFDFQIWCKEYGKTYPSLKEKLYRFSVFKERFERNASMPNGFGDRTADELEHLLPLGSYDDYASEEEFFKSLHKRVGNTYRVYEENNKVFVDCSGPNTFRGSDIEEEKLFERLRRNPGSTYRVFKEDDDIFCVHCF